MASGAENLCENVWKVIGIEKGSFLSGWNYLHRICGQDAIASSVKLWLAASGFSDIYTFGTINADDIEVTENLAKTMKFPDLIPCGKPHFCEEKVKMALYGRFSKEPRKFSIKPVEKKMILAVALIALQFKDCSFTEIESFFNIVAESKTRKKENEHARRIAKMIPFNETTVENLKLSLLQKLNEFVQKTLLLDNINFVDCVVTRDDIGGCQAKVVCPKCGKLISVTLHKEKNAEKVRFLFGFVKRHQQYCRVITTAPHKRSANTKKSIKQRNELSATTTATDTLIADTAKPPETIPVLDNMVIVDDRSMSSEDLHTEDSSDSQENGETDSEANSGVMSEEGCEVQENDSAEDVPNPIMAPENPVLQPQQEFQQQYLNLLKQQNEAIQALIQDNKRYQAWHQRNCEQQVKNQEKLLEALQELAKKSKK